MDDVRRLVSIVNPFFSSILFSFSLFYIAFLRANICGVLPPPLTVTLLDLV